MTVQAGGAVPLADHMRPAQSARGRQSRADRSIDRATGRRIIREVCICSTAFQASAGGRRPSLRVERKICCDAARLKHGHFRIPRCKKSWSAGRYSCRARSRNFLSFFFCISLKRPMLIRASKLPRRSAAQTRRRSGVAASSKGSLDAVDKISGAIS